MGYIINGETVTDDVIEEEFEAIKDHYANLGEVVCCDRDEEFRQSAHDNVINRILLQQASTAKFGEVSEEEITARLDQLKSDHGGEEQFYANTGFSTSDEEKIRQKIASSLLVDRILESVVGPETAPDEAEVRAYYEKNIDHYMTDEEVRVSQIFKEPASHEAARECYLELREIREQLLDGADFDQLAREHGDKDENEIDLGFFKQGDSMPEIEAITFSMREGEISPIVASHFGFHLFKKTGVKASEAIPFETIKEGLATEYQAYSREQEIQAYIKKLKDEGTVEEVSEELV